MSSEKPAVQTAIATQRPGLLQAMGQRYSIEPTKFLSTLKATILSKATDEEVMAFCVVAHEYGLNPFLKEIHAFPNKSGGITPVVSVDGWASLMNRRADFDGIDFETEDTEDGKPHSVTAKIYIKGRSRPVSVTEFFAECQRSTEPWRQMPRRMLRHKALIQCARVAFGFCGIHDEDEARDIIDITPVQQQITTGTTPSAATAFRRAKPVQAQPVATEAQPEPAPASPTENQESSGDPTALSAAQNELRFVIESAGHSIDQFNRFAIDAGYTTGEFGSWGEVPDALAQKLARAKVGLINGIKSVGGAA